MANYDFMVTLNTEYEGFLILIMKNIEWLE